MPVWSPIDEIAHFGYVQSLAEGDGVPVIGRDLIRDEVLVAAKNSPTSVYREQPYQPTNTDPNWGAVRQQYEATAGPTYYALMVLPYWIGRPFGVPGELLAIRLATVALALVAIPLTWALARRLFPRHPAVWLIAPALLVATNAFSFGSVTNDPLSMTLAVAAVLALLRALDDRPTPGGTVLAGVLLGAGLVTKATTLTVAPLLVAVVVTWWWSARPALARVGRVVATVVATTTVVVLPWMWWNLSTYDALSGVDEVNNALGPPSSAFSLGRLSTELGDARLGLWANQLVLGRRYGGFWLLLVVLTGIAGIAVAWIRRSWDDLFGVALCGAALPLAFAISEAINIVLMHGTGAPVGRHLLPVLPFTLIGVAGALAVVVTRRWLPTVVGLVIALALLLEGHGTDDLLSRSYERSIQDPALAPIVDQSWSDATIGTAAILVSHSCPVAAFSIGFAGVTPAELIVRRGGESWLVTAEAVSSSLPLYRAPSPDAVWYRLPTELDTSFTIELPAGSPVNASSGDRTAVLSLDGSSGDPVARLYCRQPDARDVAFTTNYAPNHADAVTRDLLRLPLVAGVTLAAIATAGAAGVAVAGGRKRRRPHPTARSR